MISDLLANFAQWAIDFVYSFGYVGVFALIMLMNLHMLPLPTQLPLCLAGFLVGQGQFSFGMVLASSTAGAVIASLITYYVGAWIGDSRLRKLIGRIERFKLIFVSDLNHASGVFERHGGKAVLIGHLVPTIGALISIPAGITRMPIFGKFMIYTVIGSVLWNGTFIVLGLVLGSHWPVVKQYTTIIEIVVVTLIVGGAAWFLWNRWKARNH